MILNPYLFRKVVIVGVGLIGGSLGLAMKKRKLAREIIGLSQRPESLTAAVQAGAIDQGYQDIKKAVVNADLVVLATPVSMISGMLSQLEGSVRRNCIITDVGSTKQSIVDAAQSDLTNAGMFVGGHPLAGSERRGVQNAREDLFDNSICILTPTVKTHRAALERMRKLWTKVGAKVQTMSPEEHDEVLGFVSHAPHLVSYALMDAIPEKHLKFASTGLKDTTRIAGSSPEVWADICQENPKHIIKGLDETVKNLATLRKAIVAEDSKTLLNFFRRAKGKRDKLNDDKG